MKRMMFILAACAVAMLQSCGGTPAETYSEKKVVEDGGSGPYKAIVLWEDDGYGARGGGFVKGKHELYPFPFDVIELNPWNEETGTGLKQNPGWE